jgi:hypothetical protein
MKDRRLAFCSMTHHPRADGRRLVTAKMAEHAFAIIELDQEQDEWRRRRVLFSRHAYDRVTLNSAMKRRRACHRRASKM